MLVSYQSHHDRNHGLGVGGGLSLRFLGDFLSPSSPSATEIPTDGGGKGGGGTRLFFSVGAGAGADAGSGAAEDDSSGSGGSIQSAGLTLP